MKFGRGFVATNKKSNNRFHLCYFRFDSDNNPRWILKNTQNLNPWDEGFDRLELGDVVSKDTRLAPPFPVKGICCIGLNYKCHAEECGVDWKKIKAPAIFSRAFTSVNSPNGDVVIPNAFNFNDTVFGSGEVQLDYEVELVVVIGKPCFRVSPAKALDYVLGYTIGNDISERSRQFQNGSGQWHPGKSLPRSFPIGPYLLSKELVNDPQNLQLQLTVNGESRQNGTTADMIFSVAECISAISQNEILLPGYTILTGTPKGVIYKSNPELIVHPWLKAGDQMKLWIGNESENLNFNRQTQTCRAVDDSWIDFFQSGELPFAAGPDSHSNND
jgi:2,4-diketo-3-deoxy-L-fuconate hydrolase